MANISFDFTNREVLQQSDDEYKVKKYTYRDIGTSKILIKTDNVTRKAIFK